MKDDFMIKIETWHKPDMGTVENVSKLKHIQVTKHLCCLNLNLIWFRPTLNPDLNKQPQEKQSVLCCPCAELRFTRLSFSLRQVHDLDEQTWRTVEVVPIDISSKEEVSSAVSFYGLFQTIFAYLFCERISCDLTAHDLMSRCCTSDLQQDVSTLRKSVVTQVDLKCQKNWESHAATSFIYPQLSWQIHTEVFVMR